MKPITMICVYLLFFSYLMHAQFVTSIIQKETDSIWYGNGTTRSTKLERLLAHVSYKLEKADTLELTYWKAYLYYKTGLSYLTDNKEKAKDHLVQGIAILEKLENPNSETLTLQGTLHSTMIGVQRNKAWPLSIKAGELFDRALKYAEQNPRAYLGLGKSDFYRPVEYGGGKMVEVHLKKAILYYNQEEQSVKKGPSWGKDEAFYFLSAFYAKNDRMRDARFYNNLGLKEFPKSELLLRQKEKIN
ncbi:MAG: hypothetical protein AAGB24_09760 [Bacteroidota bacterium]